MKIEQKKWTEKNGWSGSSADGIKDSAQLVFVFGDRGILENGSRLNEIKNFYPKAHILGCSTSGEIIGTEVMDGSVVITAVFFERTELEFTSVAINDMKDSFKCGEYLAGILSKRGLKHVMVLSDGLKVNGSGLAEGLTSKLPSDVAVTGGLAGDQALFKETLVFLDALPETNTIAAVGFYGDNISIGYGSMGGWDSFGSDRVVTKARGNILYELDKKPALELYKKYLGDEARGLPATALLFPLSLRLKEKDKSLVRTVLSIDEKDGSMIFAGDVPEGASVRLMKANFERLINGAAGAARLCAEVCVNQPPDLAILISCVGRKLVLKQRIEEEVEAVRDVLGETVYMTGFYSYGEMCPVSPDVKKCELHNQTMTITTFCER